MADSPVQPPTPSDASAQHQGDDHDSSCLPIGMRLGEFELTGLIGVGGFGIVYSARDHLLEREVAIKEYMPSALASRTPDNRVAVKSERHQETFAMGLRSFVNEAKLLAQFDHPSLVKVYRFWEANGTAYMVMPYYRGTTLRAALKSLGEAPDETAVLQMLRPMLDALDVIHAEHCYHRDIAPDNILILQSGRPVLLDFGAARRVIGDFTQALTVILKPGFAPVEQYANGPEMRQGPWTDIYALAAVMYYCIGGKTPTPSVSRMMRDTMVPARELGRGRYSEGFLAAIDHALAVRIEDRIASVAELREALGLQEIIEQPSRTRLGAGPMPAAPVAPETSAPASAAATRQGSGEMTVPRPAGLPADAGAEERASGAAERDRSSAPAARATADPASLRQDVEPRLPEASDPLGLGFGGVPPPTPPRPSADQRSAQEPADHNPPPVKPPSRQTGLKATAAVVALFLAGGIGWWAMRDQGPPGPPPLPTQDGKAPKTPPSPSPLPSPLPSPSPSPLPSPSPAPSPPAAYPSAPAFSPQSVVESLHELRDTDWAVSVKLRSDTLRIDRDNLQFRVNSTRPGFLYILQVGTDSAHFWQLFPNDRDRNNRIEANQELVLPRASWSVLASGPPGVNRLIAIVAPSARDFSIAGLQPTTPTSVIGEFDPAQARVAWQREGAAAFAGKPINCVLDAAACTRFGSARFDVKEVN